MTNHARNGRAREHRVIKLMEDHGWFKIMRAAGSKGPADAVLLHPFYGLCWLQVGTAANKTLGPTARDVLVTIADQTGAVPLLATSGPGIPTRFFRVTRDVPSTWQEYQI